MSIFYALYKNPLITGDTEYAARCMPVQSLDLEDIADEIVRQGSTVTRTDVLAVLEQMCEACEALMLLGFRIQMGGVFELYPRIKGRFTSKTDVYDPSRHKLDVTGNAGSRIRKAIRENGVVQKSTVEVPKPIPQEYVDAFSGDINSTLTPGNIGTINGEKLKFDDTQGDQGIWFVDSMETATKVQTVETNKPGKLTYLVPALSDGEYHVEVRSKFSKDGPVRTGRLEEALLVGPLP